MKRNWQDASQEEFDEEQDLEDWSSTNFHLSPSSKNTPLQSYANVTSPLVESDLSRTIVHIDLDCFYAQVEMIKNPQLRTQPLGIQQKNIVVTCNYVAREFGVKKLMYISDAKKKCPQLVLVSGEDLTHYREYSDKVTDLLQSEFSSLVEKLGFDENFVDVTSLVEKTIRANEQGSSVEVKGHTFVEDGEIACLSGCHKRMAIGSQIAAKMRERLRESFGITGCAGIAWNKLLAKLVGEQNKPNDQTTLLPGSEGKLMLSLGNARRIPGIGHSMNKKLEAIGVITVSDLQTAPFSDLETLFGSQIATYMRNSSFGIDNTTVCKSGPPRSMSDEDSFKSCTSLSDAKDRMYSILSSLLGRLEKDGRTPQTIRLTVRKHSSTQKWLRESRQCQIPAVIMDKVTKGEFSVSNPLMEVLLVLFAKLVNVQEPFHLTLINICLTNFQAKVSQSERLDNYFSRAKHNNDSSKDLSDVQAGEDVKKTTNDHASSLRRLDQNVKSTEEFSKRQAKRVALQKDQKPLDNKQSKLLFFRRKSCKAEVTLENFRNNQQLTSKESQDETAISVARTTIESSRVTSISDSTGSLTCLTGDPNRDLSISSATSNGGIAVRDTVRVTTGPEPASGVEPLFVEPSVIPRDVDVAVFRSLPADVQEDLVREWKARTPGNAAQQTKNNTADSQQSQPSTSRPKITDFFVKMSK